MAESASIFARFSEVFSIQPVQILPMSGIRLVFFGLLAIACQSCNFITLPPAPAASPELVRKNTVSIYTPERPPEVQVWLIADKLHSGMVFPYQWLLESGFIPPEGFPECRYVTFSWGDRMAYVNQRWLTVPEVVKAIFLPSRAVMECIPINWDVAEVSPNQHIWMKSIPREQGPQVAAFLNHCTIPAKDGKPTVAGPSSWGMGSCWNPPSGIIFRESVMYGPDRPLSRQARTSTRFSPFIAILW